MLQQCHGILNDLNRAIWLLNDTLAEYLVVPLQHQLLQFKLVLLYHRKKLSFVQIAYLSTVHLIAIKLVKVELQAHTVQILLHTNELPQ